MGLPKPALSPAAASRLSSVGHRPQSRSRPRAVGACWPTWPAANDDWRRSCFWSPKQRRDLRRPEYESTRPGQGAAAPQSRACGCPWQPPSLLCARGAAWLECWSSSTAVTTALCTLGGDGSSDRGGRGISRETVRPRAGRADSVRRAARAADHRAPTGPSLGCAGGGFVERRVSCAPWSPYSS
jgi:hypothetical protein